MQDTWTIIDTIIKLLGAVVVALAGGFGLYSTIRLFVPNLSSAKIDNASKRKDLLDEYRVSYEERTEQNKRLTDKMAAVQSHQQEQDEINKIKTAQQDAELKRLGSQNQDQEVRLREQETGLAGMRGEIKGWQDHSLAQDVMIGSIGEDAAEADGCIEEDHKAKAAVRRIVKKIENRPRKGEGTKGIK